jgi:hypothetical protein
MLRITRGISEKKTSIMYLNKALVITGVSKNPYTTKIGQHLILDYAVIEYIKMEILINPEERKALDELFNRQYSESYIRSLKWHFSRKEWSCFISKLGILNNIPYYSYRIGDAIFNFFYKEAKGISFSNSSLEYEK